MKKPATTTVHIGFDLDGVLIDHAAQKIALARALGFTVRIGQVHSAVLATLMPHEQYRRLQVQLYDDPDISLRSPLMPNTVQMLKLLRKLNASFALISRRRRPQWAQYILEHHKLWPAYFNERNTYFVGAPEEKDTVARRLGITHYLDDEVEVLDCLVSVPFRYLMDPTGTQQSPYPAVRSLDEFTHSVLG